MATTIHSKYGLHPPLYRQSSEFERLGVEGLSAGVVCNAVAITSGCCRACWSCQRPG